MTQEAYDSYVAMCKEYGMKPSPHNVVSANEGVSDEQVAAIARKKAFDSLPLGHIFPVTKAQLIKLVADTKEEALNGVRD